MKRTMSFGVLAAMAMYRFFLVNCIISLWIGISSVPSRACDDPLMYNTAITKKDMFNSAGVKLKTVGSVVRQDRANYHRFRRRDRSDGHEDLFADPRQRVELEKAINRSFRGTRNSLGFDDGYYIMEQLVWDAYGSLHGAQIRVTFWHCQPPARAKIELWHEFKKQNNVAPSTFPPGPLPPPPR